VGDLMAKPNHAIDGSLGLVDQNDVEFCSPVRAETTEDDFDWPTAASSKEAVVSA
jgi:hypothetical protein